jgi:quercetin dioxygenase-like cupin family protein
MQTRVAGSRSRHETGRVILGSGDSGGRIGLAEIIARRGDEPPLHRHRREDLAIYVLAGQVTFVVDGQRVPVSSGSCVFLPRGSEHGYAIESETAHLLVVLTPAGAEGYLSELQGSALTGAAIARDGSSEAIERLVATAARHDIDITGPSPRQGVEPDTGLPA